MLRRMRPGCDVGGCDSGHERLERPCRARALPKRAPATPRQHIGQADEACQGHGCRGAPDIPVGRRVRRRTGGRGRVRAVAGVAVGTSRRQARVNCGCQCRARPGTAHSPWDDRAADGDPRGRAGVLREAWPVAARGAWDVGGGPDRRARHPRTPAGSRDSVIAAQVGVWRSAAFFGAGAGCALLPGLAAVGG